MESTATQTPTQVRITHGRGWYAGQVGRVFLVRRELYRRAGKGEDAPQRPYLTVLDDTGAATERAIHPADAESV